MIQLYDFAISGNCYKVRLLLSFLNLPFETIPVDLKAGDQKSPQFLERNLLGQVPVLRDGEVLVRDSQAILVYLARRYGGELWLPTDAEGMARVTQWLSNAANEIANGLSAARAYWLFNRKEIDIQRALVRAQGILQVMNAHLQSREWLEQGRPTIADVACFPYVALAHEGQIALEAYPQVRQWMGRFQRIPGFIKMPGV